MQEEHKKRIEEIIGQINCPKGFTCAQSGFELLCKAKDFGLDNYLECIEDFPSQCKFALPFGKTHFCQCPLRIYIAKKIKK